MKKQLIIQTLPNQKPIDRGFDHLYRKSLWLIELHYETEGNLIEVAEIQPDKKIRLTEVMDIIQQQADTLIPNGCGFFGWNGRYRARSTSSLV